MSDADGRQLSSAFHRNPLESNPIWYGTVSFRNRCAPNIRQPQFFVKMAPIDKKDTAVDLMAETDKKKDDKKKKTEEETENVMSEEDQELKERLETCVSTVLNVDKEAAVTEPLRLKALDVIVNELRTATSSMTSVPKPLKFLRPHFADIKKLHIDISKEDPADNEMLELRARLADVCSVLAMTMGNHGM